MENQADSDIVARVLAGEKEAYAVLFDRYRHLVYRLALVRLGDSELAGDILQETFMIAYQRLDRLRNPAAFGSWTARIAQNTCSNYLRRNKLKTVSSEYLGELIDGQVSNEFDDDDNNMRMEAIKRLLPKLAARYREIIELRYTREFTYDKITQFLNLPMSTVRSRLYHGRKKLIRMLQREGLL